MISPKQALQTTTAKDAAEVAKAEVRIDDRLAEYAGEPIRVYTSNMIPRVRQRVIEMYVANGWCVEFYAQRNEMDEASLVIWAGGQPAMRLWLLSRYGRDADTVKAFVVRAEDVASARDIAGRAVVTCEETTWADPTRSTCVELTANGEPGVVLRDFIAG